MRETYVAKQERESAQYRTLLDRLRKGLLTGGAPPFRVDEEGDLWVHVVVRHESPEGAVPLLVPARVPGERRLRKVADLKIVGGTSEGIYRNGGETFPEDRRVWFRWCFGKSSGEQLLAFAANVIGCDWERDGVDFHRDVGAVLPVILLGEMSVTPCSGEELGIGETEVAALRAKAEAVLARHYAFVSGFVVGRGREPHWSVSFGDSGRITIEIAKVEHRPTPGAPLCAGFGLDKRDQAAAFASRLAALHPEGRVQETGSAVLHLPEAVGYCGMRASLWNLMNSVAGMTRRVERLLPAAVTGELAALSEFMIRNEKRSWQDPEASGEEIEELIAAWRPFSAAFGEADPRKLFRLLDVDSDERRWALRFHLARTAVDLLVESWDEGSIQPAPAIDETSSVPLPPEMEEAYGAVLAMSELLPEGGAAFAETWMEARDAFEEVVGGGSAWNDDRLASAVTVLAAAVPDRFPSEEAAVRWAMVTRAMLRETVEEHFGGEREAA